ncbi:hypothetical protein [Taklimakanibacter deserti]|uniref:hypothetical protein n=1 Tax=Taklimakanibacter deserti TaxID=2267839 RepID=UPI0013C42D96
MAASSAIPALFAGFVRISFAALTAWAALPTLTAIAICPEAATGQWSSRCTTLAAYSAVPALFAI